jgi:hypothetical protein
MFTVVRHKSGIVANNIRFLFDHAVCTSKTYFRFRSVQKKLISIYFDNTMQFKQDLPTYCIMFLFI